MLFLLSKVVYWLLMPVSLISGAFICGLLTRNEKYKTRLYTVGVFLFLFFTNPFFSNLAINSWEASPLEYQSISTKYEYGVVLGGVTEPNRPPYDRIHFNKGADRLIHAIDLYKKGVIEKIIISGGSGSITFEGKKESHQMAKLALSYGVLTDDLFVESNSKNTRENAIYTKSLIGNDNQARVLLITSAFHEKRARLCFEKTGLITDSFPTDYYGTHIHPTPDDIIIPSHQSVQLWSILIKEWIGLLAYKILGYI